MFGSIDFPRLLWRMKVIAWKLKAIIVCVLTTTTTALTALSALPALLCSFCTTVRYNNTDTNNLPIGISSLETYWFVPRQAGGDIHNPPG